MLAEQSCHSLPVLEIKLYPLFRGTVVCLVAICFLPFGGRNHAINNDVLFTLLLKYSVTEIV